MTKSAPEFSRPFEIGKLPNSGAHERIVATEAECKALSKRLGLPAVHGVSAKLLVAPMRGGGFKVTGQLEADIEQESVISLERFRSKVQHDVERHYVPSAAPEDDADDDDDLTDRLDGSVIDLGELVAETLALELDPYPRKPGEVFSDSAPDEVTEAKPNPFAVLSKATKTGPGK